MEVVLHLLEDPGLTDGSTADHHPIDAVAIEGKSGLFARGDIPVADDGYVHTGIVLDGADERPVSLTGVHLSSGTSVDGEGLDTYIL